MVTIRPEIAYDKGKCGDPRVCLKCIKTCPVCVLAYKPSEMPEKGKPPEDWVIVGTCRVMCTYPTCNLCIDACPNNALNITVPNA
jgi:NAD-dependent dihydropyrimidine dehydrogenase PreA subunit